MRKILILLLAAAVIAGYVYLAIILSSTKRELTETHRYLSQVSLKKELWETAFRKFYTYAKESEWRMARSYAGLALSGAYSEVVGLKKLGLKPQYSVRLAKMWQKLAEHELGE